MSEEDQVPPPGYLKIYEEDPPIEDIVKPEDVALIKDVISLL